MDRRLIVGLCVVGFILLLAGQELPPRVTIGVWAAFAAVCYGLWLWTVRPQERRTDWAPPPDFRLPHEEELRGIEQLPLDEARTQVEAKLAKRDGWWPEAGEPENPNLVRRLAPGQRAFFEKYGTVESAYGDGRMGMKHLKPFKWPQTVAMPFGSGSPAERKNHQFTQIGVDHDGDPILARPDSETVYVAHGTRSDLVKWWCADYPSIFHWILISDFRSGQWKSEE